MPRNSSRSTSRLRPKRSARRSHTALCGGGRDAVHAVGARQGAHPPRDRCTDRRVPRSCLCICHYFFLT
jgi:hypothetical protein